MVSSRDEPMTFLSLAIDLLKREAMVGISGRAPEHRRGVHRLQYEEEDTIWIQYESAFSGTGVMNRKALVP
jgi:hypothetical protein